MLWRTTPLSNVTLKALKEDLVSKIPEVTRTYINHHLDSTRWGIYHPRADDIIVTTSYKSGTTYTQQILYNLLVESTSEMEVYPDFGMASPWIDARHWGPKEDLGTLLESQEHRRFLKSHLPLDGLPYFPEVKYIIVARDARDVFMSLLNHYGAYTDSSYAELNSEGVEPLPRYRGDPHALFEQWITRGWFEWEQEGYPFWAHMGHVQSYWDYRHLPNFMFLHYRDMVKDVAGTVVKICDFIERPIDDKELQQVVRAVSFDRVKQQAKTSTERQEGEMDGFFDGGTATFINKGTNGRWRDFLTEEELALYRETRDRVLSPDCARWLEQGGEVS